MQHSQQERKWYPFVLFLSLFYLFLNFFNVYLGEKVASAREKHIFWLK